jgi:hypothetical protein
MNQNKIFGVLDNGFLQHPKIGFCYRKNEKKLRKSPENSRDGSIIIRFENLPHSKSPITSNKQAPRQ